MPFRDVHCSEINYQFKKIGTGPIPDANVEQRSTRTHWVAIGFQVILALTDNYCQQTVCEREGHFGAQCHSVLKTNQDNDIFNQTRLELM